jgi:hypothetical protein
MPTSSSVASSTLAAGARRPRRTIAAAPPDEPSPGGDAGVPVVGDCVEVLSVLTPTSPFAGFV